MYRISKTFKFDMGHKVRTQNLNKELALSNVNKCKFMHGHTVTIEVGLKGKELSDDQMVLDFNNLNFFKEFINTYFDHSFIIDKNDILLLTIENLIKLPFNEVIKQEDKEDEVQRVEKPINQIIKRESVANGYISKYNIDELWKAVESIEDINQKALLFELILFLRSFTIIDVVPTAENMSKYFYKYISRFLEDKGIDAKVDYVKFFETPSSQATYEGE
jgi:6-pyruvoyl tetrahydropterin synthase/QueD family protein